MQPVESVMDDTMLQFRQQLLDLVESYRGRLRVVDSIVAGQLPRDRLQALGIRMYAEARAALQVKLPERIRICPLDAVSARKFWWFQLAEESGSFESGQDHASLLAVTCKALGISQRDLDTGYVEYVPRVAWMQDAHVSLEMTLSQISEYWVEESVFAHEANRIADALHNHYGLPADSLGYFRIHGTVDIEHSAAGTELLVANATTPDLQRLVVDRARECLERFPIWAE